MWWWRPGQFGSWCGLNSTKAFRHIAIIDKTRTSIIFRSTRGIRREARLNEDFTRLGGEWWTGGRHLGQNPPSDFEIPSSAKHPDLNPNMSWTFVLIKYFSVFIFQKLLLYLSATFLPVVFIHSFHWKQGVWSLPNFLNKSKFCLRRCSGPEFKHPDRRPLPTARLSRWLALMTQTRWLL